MTNPRDARRGVFQRATILLAIAAVLAPGLAANVAAAATTGGAIHVVSIGSSSMAQNDVVITGAFADAGNFTVAKSPTVPLHLSKGTLQVSFAKGGAAENAIFSDMSKYLNPTTCAFVASFTSTYPIVGGTGAYAGAHGSVALKSSLTGVFPRLSSGKCNVAGSPIGFLNTAEGSGTVTFN